MAQSCVSYNPDASIHDYDLIFLGEVISAKEHWMPQIAGKPRINRGTLLKYKVLKPYKGVTSSKKEILINYNTKRPSNYFEEGEIGLVVARYNDEINIYVTGHVTFFGGMCGNEPGYYQNEDVMAEVDRFYTQKRKNKQRIKAVGLAFMAIFILMFASRKSKIRESGTQ